MIAYIEGVILHTEADALLLKTSVGIAYRVYVPSSILSQAQEGQELALYTHTYVREDEITLYGFASTIEHLLFKMLIKTSGIGPRMGIGVLSHFSAQQLTQLIQNEDVPSLTQIKGIGKKTAAKLCLDMKDRIKKEPSLQALQWSEPSIVKPASKEPASSKDMLLSALTNMGFTKQEVLPVLRQVSSEQGFGEELKQALALLAPLR